MPSIGTAKTSKALIETLPAVASSTAAVVAMENPGALPAIPMMTDSKSDIAPGFSVALISHLLWLKIKRTTLKIFYFCRCTA
jgi:hypothetical protein